ncbi:MAG: hypothetical protein H7249_06350 [Chitinophagaceae bacterium]|nr:hypothetical protein [Oligoflexus sp.]
MTLRFFGSNNLGIPKLNQYICVLVLLVFGSPLFAEEAAKEIIKESAGENIKEDSKAFSGAASLALRSSTSNASEYNYRILLSPSLNVEYEFKNRFTLGLSVRGTKDLNNEMLYTLTDTTVSASRHFELAEGLNFGVDVSYGAPVSKQLYRYANAKGTAGGSVSLRYQFSGVLTGLSLSGGLTYDRYLYQYQFADGGAILTKYSVSQSYGVTYTWNKLITGSVSFTDVTSWDFDGSQENDTYLFVETVQYHINEAFAVQAGHINDGTTYDYLGEKNNVKIYDRYRSQVFIGGTYSF